MYVQLITPSFLQFESGFAAAYSDPVETTSGDFTVHHS